MRQQLLIGKPIRRRPITLALGLLVALPAAEAQRREKIPLVGVLEPNPSTTACFAAFQQGLRDLGYVEGQNITFAYRYAAHQFDRLPALAAELVQLTPDVIWMHSNAAALAAKQAITTIPVVNAATQEIMELGVVESLARPGGNLTGLSFAYSEGFGGKWVEFLKEAVPAVTHVALLHHPSTQLSTGAAQDIQSAAQALGLTLQPFAVSEPGELDGAFALMSTQRAGALIVDNSVFLYTHQHRVIALAAQHRLPAIYGFRNFVDAGGLMSYGVSIADLWRRAATYVDKIFKGAKPADLSVEQPLKFELLINLKTAKALGMMMPPSLLLLADEVIQ